MCIQTSLPYMILGTINVLEDLTLLVEPLPAVWGLRMRKRMKVQVMSFFCIGGLYVVLPSCAGYVRIYVGE